MSTPASSPPSTPSLSKLQAQCICALSEITNQLLNEDASVRFQCLAYYRYGKSTIQRRCENSCQVQSRPQVFERAKKILQRKASITFVDYVGVVIRILFCKTHSEAKAFGKYHDLLQQHWKGDGTPKELELLNAISQAYQLSSAHSVQGPNIGESSSPPTSKPSTPNPEADGPDSNIQLNISPVLPDVERVTSAPPEQGQPVAFAGSFLARKRHLLPIPPSQRMRTRSNPPQQRKEINPAAKLSVHTADGTIKDSEPVHTSSNPYRIPSDAPFEFRFPGPHIPFTLQQVRSQAPSLNSTQSAPDVSLSRKSVPSEQVSDTSLKVISSSSLPGSSKPTAHNQNIFLQAHWDSLDFSSSFSPSGLRRNHFRPTPMAMGSKDDIFVEQVSNSAAKATPTLFQTTIQQSVPEREPRNGPDQKGQSFIPSLVDTWIRDAVLKPVTKEGFVYVLKAPKYFEKNYPGEPPLVKIGIAMDVNKRISDLKNDCGLFDLEKVGDCIDTKHRWYYKVEELVHSELANFNKVLKCGKCRTGKGEPAAHREWFAVPETVALQAVQRWRTFIQEEPYDENGILIDHWSEMVKPKNIIWQTNDEQYDDHEKRNNRWNRWFEEGIKASRRLK